MKPLGRVNLFREAADDSKSLRQLNFETGDYLDLGVVVTDGAHAGTNLHSAGSGGRGGRGARRGSGRSHR